MDGAVGIGSALPDGIVIAAARCWRSARDAKRPVQPSLHAVLAPHGCEMLTPVFDSLMTLCECCFRRSLCTGCPLAPTADERMLCRLLADPSQLDLLVTCRGGAHSGGAMELAFACALSSARVMIDLTLEPTRGGSGGSA